MRCLIVDDEILAQEVIELYISKVPGLTLVGKCTNAFSALEVINSQAVDVLFLDIQMPHLNGIEFLKTISNTPRVVIISAYAEYAIEGYSLDVVDYLLKPVSFPRFMQAVSKLQSLPKK